MLRKGAMSYAGSIPTTVVDPSLRDNYLKLLTSTEEGTLGYLNKMLYWASSTGHAYQTYDNDYIMLGDPTLVPKYNYIEGFNYECYDFIDNDNDGLMDWDDCGCSYSSGSEFLPEPECHDGIDNDNDNLIDYPEEYYGCSGPCEDDEGEVECWDGIDNDNDGYIDYLEDDGCINQYDDDETICGHTITASITLEEDLNCEGNGLIIGGGGVILDCNGHMISHIGNPGYGSGIDLSNVFASYGDITVRNCLVRNFYNGIVMGLWPWWPYYQGYVHLISNDLRSNTVGISIVGVDDIYDIELASNTVLENSAYDIKCSWSNGIYTNNICETIFNEGCNPEVTCEPP